VNDLFSDLPSMVPVLFMPLNSSFGAVPLSGLDNCPIKVFPIPCLKLWELKLFQHVHTAMSKKTQADYCGFVDNSVDKENFWNIKAWRARLGPEELVDNLFALHERRHYSAIGIEKTSYTWGLKPFIDAEQRLRNKFLPIVELEHSQTNKEVRIRGVIPRYASGSIRHVEGACDALEEEQMQFPNGAHDDVLDALAYQVQIVKELKPRVHISKPKPRRI